MKKIKIGLIAILSTTMLLAPLMTACKPTGSDGQSQTDREVVRIQVVTKPTKTVYAVGEYFDPTGMVVRATYDNGDKEDVTGYTYDKTAPLTIEDKRVTISYQNKTTTLVITVQDPADLKEVSSIQIKTQPTKLAYTSGELFDPTGLVIQANYSDGTSGDVTSGYTYDKTEELQTTDTVVTITYTTKTATIAITVTAGQDTVEPRVGTTRFEAEGVNISKWVISSANPSKVVAREDASGGKFLAAATGDTANSGTFEFYVDLEFNAEIELTAAYAQSEKW